MARSRQHRRKGRAVQGERHWEVGPGLGQVPANGDRLGVREQQTVAKTLRRTLLSLPGRLTRSARRWTLHLPASWPWAHSFQVALRCIPHPT